MQCAIYTEGACNVRLHETRLQCAQTLTKDDSMLRKIFLILSAILLAVSAIYLFFDGETARKFMGGAMIAFALHIISFIIWGTEVEHKKH